MHNIYKNVASLIYHMKLVAGLIKTPKAVKNKHLNL